MEVIKKHIVMIIMGVIVIGLSVWLFLWDSGVKKELDKVVSDVRTIKEDEDAFTKYKMEWPPFAESQSEGKQIKPGLTRANVAQAEANKIEIQKRYNELLAALDGRFPKPESAASGMLGIQLKSHLRGECAEMENLLRGEEKDLPDSLKHFGFDRYFEPQNIPKTEEIQKVLLHLEVIKEIVFVISQSNVAGLFDFKPPELDPIDRELFQFKPFTIRVRGEMAAVRELINAFNEAKYCFMVRNIKLGVSALDRGTRPALGQANSDGDEVDELIGRQRRQPTQESSNVAGGVTARLPKARRLVFPRKADIDAEIRFDYVEFKSSGGGA